MYNPEPFTSNQNQLLPDSESNEQSTLSFQKNDKIIYTEAGEENTVYEYSNSVLMI